MGVRNFLVEGVTGTGKTSVCHELRRRGHDAVNGDTDLARPLSPGAVLRTAAEMHANHGWDVARVRERAADRTSPLTFFCGVSRNASDHLDVFDAVLVLEVDRATLEGRLDARPPGEWGSAAEQRALVLHLRATQEDVPPGVAVDATRPLSEVVDEVLRIAGTY